MLQNLEQESYQLFVRYRFTYIYMSLMNYKQIIIFSSFVSNAIMLMFSC